MVGPPGLSINAVIKKALTNVDKQFELFNCGDEITKIQGGFREEDKARFSSCLLVEEASIAGIMGQIEALSKAEQNYIIEGFPKNIKQAQLLQEKGIYAKNLLLINIDDAGLREIIGRKIEQLHPQAKSEERDRLVALAAMEHKMYRLPHSATCSSSSTSTASTWKSTSPPTARRPSSSASSTYAPTHSEGL